MNKIVLSFVNFKDFLWETDTFLKKSVKNMLTIVVSIWKEKLKDLTDHMLGEIIKNVDITI